VEGYLLGSAVTDESCDAGDEFYYSWVKTDACLKGLDNGQGSRKFTECSGANLDATSALFILYLNDVRLSLSQEWP